MELGEDRKRVVGQNDAKASGLIPSSRVVPAKRGTKHPRERCNVQRFLSVVEPVVSSGHSRASNNTNRKHRRLSRSDIRGTWTRGGSGFRTVRTLSTTNRECRKRDAGSNPVASAAVDRRDRSSAEAVLMGAPRPSSLPKMAIKEMGKSHPLRQVTLVHFPAIVNGLTEAIIQQQATIERLERDASRGAIQAVEARRDRQNLEHSVRKALGNFGKELPIVEAVGHCRDCCEEAEAQINRLPKPPEIRGDGETERVTFALEKIAVAEAVEKHRALLTAEAAKLEADANAAEALGDPEAAATVRTIAAALREILAAPVKVETRKVWTAEYRVARATGSVGAGEFVALAPSVPAGIQAGDLVDYPAPWGDNPRACRGIIESIADGRATMTDGLNSGSCHVSKLLRPDDGTTLEEFLLDERVVLKKAVDDAEKRLTIEKGRSGAMRGLLQSAEKERDDAKARLAAWDSPVDPATLKVGETVFVRATVDHEPYNGTVQIGWEEEGAISRSIADVKTEEIRRAPKVEGPTS